ncbi:hypothetical protein Tco_0957938, partial [Tanacetum coccineum]
LSKGANSLQAEEISANLAKWNPYIIVDIYYERELFSGYLKKVSHRKVFGLCAAMEMLWPTLLWIDRVLKGDIELHFIPTQYQLADIFTKPLDEQTFKRLIVELGMLNIDSKPEASVLTKEN